MHWKTWELFAHYLRTKSFIQKYFLWKKVGWCCFMLFRAMPPFVINAENDRAGCFQTQAWTKRKKVFRVIKLWFNVPHGPKCPGLPDILPLTKYISFEVPFQLQTKRDQLRCLWLLWSLAKYSHLKKQTKLGS